MEKIIREYLEKFAVENNWNKFDESKLSKCIAYIRGQAQLQAENGVACIPDAEVYSWAVHFYDEDGNVEVPKKEKKEFEKGTKTYLENVKEKADKVIKEEANVAPAQPKSVTKAKKAKKEEDTNQMSLFDMLGE